MPMTDHQTTKPEELSQRLDFIRLGEDGVAKATAFRTQVHRHLGTALDLFYDRIAQVPAVQAFFSGSDQVARAKGAQAGHWNHLAEGELDGNYLDNARKIGLRHARIGLEPRWYIGGYSLIAETLIKGVIQDVMVERLRP